jgi:tetratricopeptide (TPR) repeat protein
VKRVIEPLIIGIIASLIAGLILAPYLIPVIWQAYKIELSIAVLFIIALGLLYFIWERSATIKKAFDVSKPVRKLTPEGDFHITNYDKFYIERESDKEIENLLRERKYVFVTGIPMLGKTRMAYESVKKLKGFYLLKPKYGEINIGKLKLPFFKKKIVLFLDDLDKYAGKFNLDDLVRKLKEKAKDFVVIATCRSGKEFDQVFAKKEMEALLTQCERNKTEPRLLKQQEESELANAVGKNLKKITSDRTPGSITIDLRYMKERYEDLGDEKSILKCLKLLREGNIFLWKENLVKEVSNGIFDLNIERTRWDGYVDSLSHNGFIKMSSERISISHDVYLDNKFLDDYFVNDHDLKSLKEILFDKLKDPENLFYLGNRFYYKKNSSEAEDCYRKSIDTNPDFAEAHNNLGVLFSELKRYPEAEKEYREALRINPDFAAAHNNLGLLFSELKRYPEAEKEYKEALGINSDYASAHYNLGILLSELKRYPEAEKEYKEALRINPDYTEAHNNLGILLYELKRYPEAEKEYKEALRINPDYANAHYNLGALLYDLKRYPEAEKEYKDALRINPDDADAHYNLGILLSELKRYEEAEEEYKDALRINPDDALAHNNLGNLLYKLKRYDEAEKEYKEALRINPDLAEAHYNLGILLYELKRYPEAEKEYKETLRLNPDYAKAHYNLGVLLYDLKRYAEAEKEWKEVLRIDPEDAEAHHSLGELFMALNRKGEAKKEFEIARGLFRKQGREEDAKKAEEFLRKL